MESGDKVRIFNSERRYLGPGTIIEMNNDIAVVKIVSLLRVYCEQIHVSLLEKIEK